MSLIARCMQLFDYQYIPVQWQEKMHVTDVTKLVRVTLVTCKKQANVTWGYWYSTDYTIRAMSDIYFQTFLKSTPSIVSSWASRRISETLTWCARDFSDRVLNNTSSLRSEWQAKKQTRKGKTKNRLHPLKILLQLCPHSSSRIKNVSSTVVAVYYFFLSVILAIP